jgi:hypothetical protein
MGKNDSDGKVDAILVQKINENLALKVNSSFPS